MHTSALASARVRKEETLKAKGVFQRFKDDLDELVKCGGAEAQGPPRERLHDAFKAMPKQTRTKVLNLNREHKALQLEMIQFGHDQVVRPKKLPARSGEIPIRSVTA